jgi:putative membrane protein insertion efficiency factor
MRGSFVELALRGYKRLVSPALPASCRFVPTCSEYAAEAVLRYGLLRGGAIALWRLLRCHPLAHGGHDPVPGQGYEAKRNTRVSTRERWPAPLRSPHNKRGKLKTA